MLFADSLPRRWSHVCAAAAAARRLAAGIRLGDDADVLVAAVWLHDVGYAPGAAETGFHPLDGARWLRTNGFGDRLAGLVAYHSCAIFEAAERGLAANLRAEFIDEGSLVRDALWYVDMTTGPDGRAMTVTERLAEVRQRYGPEHVVTRAWRHAEPVLRSAVRRFNPEGSEPDRSNGRARHSELHGHH
jgi:HD domain-containing protein